MVNDMFDIALRQLAGLNVCPEGLPVPQVTVLRSKQGNTYVTENDLHGATCAQLKEKGDTQIVKCLTVWKGGQIDLPSWQFRRALLALDERNCDVELLLQGKNGVVAKKLSDIERI